MLPAGAALSLAAVIMLALLLPTAKLTKTDHHHVCKRYPLIRVMWICGPKVMYENPDGSRVVIGTTRELFRPVHIPLSGVRPAATP